MVHSPILISQDRSNETRGSNSPSLFDSVCPTVLEDAISEETSDITAVRRANCRMFIPAFTS
ncbi:MAG: hypothetical protein ACRC2V_06150, partial [Xenococcaceae cyanobacterium]